jgi:L-ascorbate metabolism protein UlaG (beta-lactamase superfamily)
LRITWLGHSTQLIEIDGQRVLLDPVWSKRASPTSIAGPKRFHAPPLPLSELPDVDAVVISHDHYDHLDYQTIKVLARAQKKARFVVPLGVGAHLVGWGVEAKRIVELDWWGEARVGKLRLVATPARHFSGRSLLMVDRNKTLWQDGRSSVPSIASFFPATRRCSKAFARSASVWGRSTSR